MRSFGNSWITICILFPVLASAYEPSFEGETFFVANPIQGTLFVRCRGGESAWKTCRGNMLNPTGSFAHFGIDGPVEADRVTLKSTWQSGREITKRHRWDREANQTRRPVNLWIDTLLQNPLLDYGVNQVEYQFSSSRNQHLETRSFSVIVEEGEPMICPDDNMYSGSPQDCSPGTTAICDQYFAEHNYCRD